MTQAQLEDKESPKAAKKSRAKVQGRLRMIYSQVHNGGHEHEADQQQDVR